MEKFIPFDKLSKKRKRELNAKRRKGWNGLNPVTRRPENPKAYVRRKVQKRNYDPDSAPFYFHLLLAQENYSVYNVIIAK